MKICALEVPAGFGDPGGRLADIRSALAQGEAADLIVVPECALTGYVSRDLRTRIFRTLVRRFGLTVVNANWGEGEPRVRGQGRSRIVGPGGVVEAPRLAGQVSRVSAEVLPKPAARSS